MITNIEELKKAGRRTAVVTIPGTEETIALRELTVKDRADYMLKAKEAPEDYDGLAAFVLVRGCEWMTEDHIPKLLELGGDALQFLSLEVLKLSSMLKASVEEEVKN